MAQYYTLYNPLSCNGNGETNARQLIEMYAGQQLIFKNLLELDDIGSFLKSLPEEDKIIICGGDGTLNRFVNDTADVSLKNEILYFPAGTGNDFAFDFGFKRNCQPFPITEYIHNLPRVSVNGKESLFINGIGYGIDGYCCEVGDRMRAQHKEKINYASIAISGLLFHYKPTDATVTVDGVSHTYKKVWLAPTMNGRFYGGGMMPTPNQQRNSGTLSVMVFHGSGKLKTLMIFPSIFKGEHIKHGKQIEVLTGKEITVTFNRPTPLQIDGETVLGVTSYTVHAYQNDAVAAQQKQTV